MKRIAVVYVSYDGIVNLMCGVGSYTRSYLQGFKDVANYYAANYDIELNLYPVAIKLDKNADGYSENIIESSNLIAKNSGGQVYLISNGTSGKAQFGNLENWETASLNAALKALEIAKGYDKTIVLANDTPFIKMGYYIQQNKAAFEHPDIETILVAHSDTLSHHPENPDMGRLGFESSCLIHSKINPNIHIGKISTYMIDNLKKYYVFDSSKIINLQAGVLNTEDRYKLYKQSIVKNVLQKKKIPTDKDLIVSIGRAVHYKGFDILINALAQVKESSRPHLVLIASPFTGGDLVIEQLRDLLNQKKISHTAIFEIDFETPKYVSQWHRTKIVAQLARKEPFGLVPEETRLWARDGGPVILGSRTDGFVEQITHGKDGFLVDTEISKVSDMINHILKLDELKLEQIRKQGLKRAINDYEIRNSIATSLAQVLHLEYKEHTW